MIKEKSTKQLDYESALSYINSKGFDIEVSLKGSKPNAMIEMIVLKNEEKFVDSTGKDRVKRFPLDSSLPQLVAEAVIKLCIYLKSKEK